MNVKIRVMHQNTLNGDTSMLSITEFLEARIAEDEAAAEAASVSMHGERHESQLHYGSYVLSSERDSTAEQDEFILNWWPARVLAECAAKRAIVAGSHWKPRERPTDAELHFRSSHPAYEYRTTEGQRKAWDDADEPPEGEGWERNIDSGRDGWDRFDFHEESYWRRLKPESERKEWKQYIPNELLAIAAVYSDHPDYQQEWAQ